MPLPSAAKSVAIGPDPFRTARGAGRFVLEDERLFDEDFRRVWLPDDREREVLHLLAAGLDNAAIAKRLHLSAHTIRTHVGNILRKLEVHSRAQAARVALAADDPSRAVGVFHIRGPELPPR